MRGKHVALPFALLITASVVSGVVTSLVTIKVERLYAATSSESLQDDDDEAKPVFQRATLKTCKKALAKKR